MSNLFYLTIMIAFGILYFIISRICDMLEVKYKSKAIANTTMINIDSDADEELRQAIIHKLNEKEEN